MMISHEDQQRHRRAVTRLTLDRLNSITDGVLGFAMTLLVLNVDIPKGHNFSEQGLLQFFAGLEHDLVIYAASFFLIGRYWVEHHLIFHCIRYVNRVLVWLNFVFMFMVTMLPFATKVKGQYETDPMVAVLFGAVHVGCWLSLLAVWCYAESQPDLLQQSIDPKIAGTITRRLCAGPLVILAAIAISYINMRVGNFAFLSIPLIYLLQPRVDLHLQGSDEMRADS